MSIGIVLALDVTFGHENFVNGPVIFFTQALSDVRLEGLLILITMTYGRPVDLFHLLRYPEQLQGSNPELNSLLKIASYRKMKDWRTLLIQYILQQNRSLTGDDKTLAEANDYKKCGGMPLLTDLAVMIGIDPLALVSEL